MRSERFFDQALALIDRGQFHVAGPLLVGKLYHAFADPQTWPATRQALHRHPLHARLLEDPFTGRSVARPRGYPGDAGLIDMIYDETYGAADLPEVTPLGQELFRTSIKFQAPEGVRQRRKYAEGVVNKAWSAGQRVCALACGHLREADGLIGKDLSRFTVVDQDAMSLDVVRRNHGASIAVHQAHVFTFLRRAATRGERFDLIYTLGLTDYLDSRAMRLLHRLMKPCLAPGGTILLANFKPFHLAAGWMDAVMDWPLIYRDEGDLAAYAQEIGLKAHTWIDDTGSIAWCEMVRER